jgi:hypothetical protein
MPATPGCTTVLYEGKPVGTPDAGVFWRVIANHPAVAWRCCDLFFFSETVAADSGKQQVELMRQPGPFR